MREPAYLTRRALAAALPIAALVAAPAAALSSPVSLGHPDAELLQLVASFEAAEAHREECDERINEAFDRLEPPKIPEALYWRKSDYRMCAEPPKGRLAQYDVGGGQLEYVYESLDNLPPRWTGPQPSPLVFGKPNEQDSARASELITAVGEWQEANRRAEDAAGLTAASEAAERQYAIVAALERRLLATRARTTEGIMAKVQVMIEQWPTNSAWLEKQLQAELVKTEGREVARAFAMSLALDMISTDEA